MSSHSLASQQTLAKVKRILLRDHGADGIRFLSRAFNVMDDDGNGSISKSEFTNGLSKMGVELSEKEASAVWAAFDRNGDGVVKPTEFLTGLRGNLQPARKVLIQRAWATFPKDNAGAVSLNTLVLAYDSSRYPSVIRGETDATTIANAFAHSFDVQTNPEGCVTKQEFEQHFAGVSGVTESDSHFSAMMRGCFNLPGCNEEQTTALAFGDNSKKFAADQGLSAKEQTLAQLKVDDDFKKTVKTHTDVLLSKQVGYRNLGRRLRTADPEGTGYLSRDDFIEALWKGRLYIESQEILSILDSNSDGSVDYLLYLGYVKGDMPPARRLLMERLWKSFPRDRNDQADLSAIHARYHAPNGDELNQFLDAWDRLNSPGKVSYEELEEWLIPQSAKISLDSVFEDMLKKQWGA